MSRTLRPQMPGVAFHITARVQNEEDLFVPEIRGNIERIIVEGVTTSDAWLIAHTVMPNHFHIVLRQGSRSLGWIMQPIMRRIALLINARRETKGHVFERRFRSLACENADYLRRVVVYTNINAKRARLCRAPEDYAWSTHAQFVTCEDGTVESLQVIRTLRLFGHERRVDPDYLRACYLNYIEWRLEKDAWDEKLNGPFPKREPPSDAGDRYFAQTYCALPPLRRTPLKDLRDKAIELLEEIDVDVAIESLRKRFLPRRLVAVRDQLITALHQSGYAGKNIAGYLRISDTKVSEIATKMRYGELG